MANFVSTWNNLLGRSTTKSDDLWVILASCLGFKHRQLRMLESSEEKMQRMILSIQTLPLTLFFNEGPRLRASENHHNRWIPTQISRNFMREGSKVVLPSLEVSKYSDQGMRIEAVLESDVTAVLVDCIVPGFESYLLLTESETYRVRSLVDPSDRFKTAEYSKTCIIIETELMQAKDALRGACFYVKRSGRSVKEIEKPPCLEMVYFCPVLVTRTESQESAQPQEGDHLFPAHCLDADCKYWIRFNPIPGFKQLKRQQWPAQLSNDTVEAIVVAAGMIPLAPWKLACFVLPIATLVMLGPWQIRFPAFLAVIKEYKEYFWHQGFGAGPWPWKALIVIAANCIGGFLFMMIDYLGYVPGGVAGGLAAIILYVTLRVRDYLWIYQSYDDNTVIDRLGRLGKALAAVPVDATHAAWRNVRRAIVDPTKPRLILEEFEV